MTPVQTAIFIGLVFGAVMLLSYALIIPTVSSGARATRNVRKRISSSLPDRGQADQSLVRESFAGDSAGVDKEQEDSALTRLLEEKINQAGLPHRASKIIFWSVLWCMAGLMLGLVVFKSLPLALLASVLFLFLPYSRLCSHAKKRIALFEEQLPEALDVMSRALKAGHPFNETMNFVAQEMDEPIAGEFGRVFSDINYGMPSKEAFYALMERIPSVSLHTLVTAVLIQQESGGALAEILEKVAEVIRGRFRLQRKLKTLSAEGRMSAWVLTLLPFGLAGMLMVVSPDYLPILLTDSTGQKIIAAGVGMLCLGVVWIKFIINIKV